MLTTDLPATRRVTIDEKPRGKGGGKTSRYRKESFTRVEGYEDKMDAGDAGREAYEEAEGSRHGGSPLESLFAALQGPYFGAKRCLWTNYTQTRLRSSNGAKDIQSQDRFSDKDEGYV